MAAYNLIGPRWGSGPVGTGATVSWAIDNTIPTSFLAEIKAAFATWSSYANLTFQQVTATASANISFNNSYLDGRNNVLGQASYSYSGQRFISAEVTFDSGEGWRPVGSDVRSGSGVDLYVVALHEIGHALGLGHYDDTPALMNAYLTSSVTGPAASDIAGIQALYGARVAAPVSLPAPVATADTYTATVGQTLSRTGTGVLANDSVANGAALSVTSINGVAGNVGKALAGSYGALTLNADGSFTYTPGASKAGSIGGQLVDHFTYAATANGQTATASLDITVTGAGWGNAAWFGSYVHDASGAGGKVYALYNGLLGRSADPLGLSTWTDAVEHGTSIRDVARQFLASTEGQARAGAIDNAGFVEQLYGATLNRHSDPAGLASWTGALAQGASRTDVALGFALSPEHLANLQAKFNAGVFVPDADAAAAARLYHGILGRAPDAAGLTAARNAIENGTSVTALAQQFLASREAQTKFAGVDDARFVTGLYENALGRTVDAGGLKHWVATLQQGTSRAEVAALVSESHEAQVHLVGRIEGGWDLV